MPFINILNPLGYKVRKKGLCNLPQHVISLGDPWSNVLSSHLGMYFGPLGFLNPNKNDSACFTKGHL